MHRILQYSFRIIMIRVRILVSLYKAFFLFLFVGSALYYIVIISPNVAIHTGPSFAWWISGFFFVAWFMCILRMPVLHGSVFELVIRFFPVKWLMTIIVKYHATRNVTDLCGSFFGINIVHVYSHAEKVEFINNWLKTHSLSLSVEECNTLAQSHSSLESLTKMLNATTDFIFPSSSYMDVFMGVSFCIAVIAIVSVLGFWTYEYFQKVETQQPGVVPASPSAASPAAASPSAASPAAASPSAVPQAPQNNIPEDPASVPEFGGMFVDMYQYPDVYFEDAEGFEEALAITRLWMTTPFGRHFSDTVVLPMFVDEEMTSSLYFLYVLLEIAKRTGCDANTLCRYPFVIDYVRRVYLHPGPIC